MVQHAAGISYPCSGILRAIPVILPSVAGRCSIVGRLNKAVAGREWFHPKGTPWRQMIAGKGPRTRR